MDNAHSPATRADRASRMHVLFVTHAFPRHEHDVAGAFIHRLAVALQARGTRVTVLAPSAPGLAREETIAGVAVRRFRYAPRSWETLAYAGTMAEQVTAGLRGKLALLGFVVGARRELRRQLAALRPDVMHAHWWFPCGLAAAASRASVPLVVTSHGSDLRLAARSSLARMLFRRVARRAAAYTAVSDWLVRTARAMGAPRDVTVAPMPVDVTRFEPSVAERARSVLFVGRLNAQKGPADLLAAAKTLPGDVTFDIVGDGPDRGALEARAQSSGLAERVHWHGQLPQSAVVSFYRRAAVVAVPSREEGLGLVVVEALLTATPVVAYRSGGVAELVDDGVTGVLAEPGDVAGFSGSLAALLRDPARAHRMGLEGRARMVARFAPDAVAAGYDAIYARVAR